MPADTFTDWFNAQNFRHFGAGEFTSYFAAVPRRWALDPARPYPLPVIGLAEGRERALAALAQGKA